MQLVHVDMYTRARILDIQFCVSPDLDLELCERALVWNATKLQSNLLFSDL